MAGCLVISFMVFTYSVYRLNYYISKNIVEEKLSDLLFHREYVKSQLISIWVIATVVFLNYVVLISIVLDIIIKFRINDLL